MWQDCTEQAGHTWTVALFSPVVGRLTFWVAFQGPLPSWTAIASVPTSPATGAFRYASKLSSHAAVGVVLLAHDSSCAQHSAMKHNPKMMLHILGPRVTALEVAAPCSTWDSAYTS